MFDSDGAEASRLEADPRGSWLDLAAIERDLGSRGDLVLRLERLLETGRLYQEEPPGLHLDGRG